MPKMSSNNSQVFCLSLKVFSIEVFSNLNVKHQRLGFATSYRKQQLQSIAAGLYKSFVAVFSGGVLTGLNFVILSFGPSNSTEFFYLFPCRLLRRTGDVLHTKLVSLTQ